MRRLDLGSFRGRFFTLLVIYVLFTLKTILDRSGIEVIKEASWLPVMAVAINGLVILDGRVRSRFPRLPLLLAGSAACFATLAFAAAWRPNLLPRFHLPGAANLAILRASLRSTATPEEMLEPTAAPELGARSGASARSRACWTRTPSRSGSSWCITARPSFTPC